MDTKKYWPGLRSLELIYLGLASSKSGRYLPPLKIELPRASVSQYWAMPYPPLLHLLPPLATTIFT